MIEQKLIKKLRVELKNWEINAINRTMCQKKENNWMADSKQMSVDRHTEKPVVDSIDKFRFLSSKR